MIDEEITSLTIWRCFLCQYEAFEVESDERICSRCANKTETKLKDEYRQYRWCSTCNTIEEL